MKIWNSILVKLLGTIGMLRKPSLISCCIIFGMCLSELVNVHFAFSPVHEKLSQFRLIQFCRFFGQDLDDDYFRSTSTNEALRNTYDSLQRDLEKRVMFGRDYPLVSKQVESKKEATISSHRGVFCGFHSTKEEKERLKSANFRPSMADANDDENAMDKSISSDLSLEVKSIIDADILGPFGIYYEKLLIERKRLSMNLRRSLEYPDSWLSEDYIDEAVVEEEAATACSEQSKACNAGMERACTTPHISPRSRKARTR